MHFTGTKYSPLQSSRWGRESLLLYFCFVLMLCHCYCSVNLRCGAMGWSVVCDCGTSWSYSLYLLIDFKHYVSFCLQSTSFLAK